MLDVSRSVTKQPFDVIAVERRPAQQILQRVGKSLDLKELGPGDRPAGADDRVAGADQDGWIGVDRPGAVLELPGEALVHAAEIGFLRLRQIQIGKEPPQPDREVAHQRLLDPAEPAHELGQQPPGNAVGQQEIDVLLLKHTQHLGSQRHGPVNSLG